MFETTIKLPSDPTRYCGLPEEEQRRLFQKKLRALDARGVRPVFKGAPGSPAGMPYWEALAFLDALLECPLCATASRGGQLPDAEAG